MSKYHKGDKFIVEIKEVMESDNGTLYRSDFKTLTFDDNGLDKLQKYKQPTISEDTLEMEQIKALNDGRNEVWELVRRLYNTSLNEIKHIFGVNDFNWDEREIIEVIVKQNTPQEALAKLEAYEKKIEVGDVIERMNDGAKFLIITEEHDSSEYDFGVIVLQDMTIDRITGSDKHFKKTGKHIDIQSVLSQIAE